MKKLILAVITALLLLTACNQHDSITSPDNSDKISSDNLSLVKLPARDKNSLSKEFKTGAFISLTNGGSIVLKEQYTSVDGRTVTVAASIVFPPNYLASYSSSSLSSVSSDPFIIMYIDDATASVQFYPEMVFTPGNEPILNFIIEGVRVFDGKDYDFRYVADNGTTEPIEKELIVDAYFGKLEVKNAVLPHFSRYGYLN